MACPIIFLVFLDIIEDAESIADICRIKHAQKVAIFLLPEGLFWYIFG